MKGQRFAAFARLLCAVLCGVLIFVGLLQLENAGVRLDLTQEQLTSLSEGTLQTLQAMQEEVTFHLVFQEGTDTDLRSDLETLTQTYALEGSVKVDVIDPVTEPGKISPYQTTGTSISEGSVIVTNADDSRFQVVSARDMYTYTVSTDGTRKRTGIAAEQKLTAALRSVIGEGNQTVYFLTGHREASSSDCSELVERLEGDGYTAEDFVLQGEGVPENSVLMILSPAVDLTDDEYSQITEWLDNGGRLFYACDASLDMDTMPHFAQLAQRYSLDFESGIVVEDSNEPNYWVSSPLYLMPEIQRDTEAASGMSSSSRVLVPGSRAISGPEIPLSGYTYQTILNTSSKAYIKRTDSEAYTREEGDPQGTQQLAVSVAHEIEGTGAELRMVLMGSLYTTMDNALLASSSNLDLTMNMIAFLAEREDEVSVPVREVANTSMQIPSASSALVILGITLVLPVVAVVTSVIVIVRRRRK